MATVHLLFYAAAGPLVGVAAEDHLSEPLHRPALQFGHDLGQVGGRLLVDDGHVTQDVPLAARLVAAEGAAVELDEDVVAVGVELDVLRQVLAGAELTFAQFAEELLEVKAHRQFGHFGSHVWAEHVAPAGR